MSHACIFIFAVVASFLILSCNDKSEKSTTTDDSTSASTDRDKVNPNDHDSTDLNSCYLFVSGRDSYMLRINQALIGKLEFRNFEKDKSFGTVKGENINDLIKIWYNFQSEGMNSVSEMYFKKSGNDLIRGLSADPIVSNDTAYYGKLSNNDFEKGQLFKRIECTDFRFRDE